MPRAEQKRKPYKKAIIVLTALVVVLLFRLVEDIGREQMPGDRFVVVRVIDGDTVELAGGDRLRLLGIDTPEKGEVFYDRATAFLEELALGKRARIEYADKRRDRYGRLLGFVYVEDTVFVNRRILAGGFGNLYLVKDQELNRPRFKELLLAQREAIANKSGIWAVAREQEDFYVAGPTSLRFHRPGCSSVSKTNQSKMRTFDFKQEALFEGLSPCRNCRP
jgi:micrococcal nuclease